MFIASTSCPPAGRTVLCAWLLLAGQAAASRAAEHDLHWKFAPGETWQVSFHQTAETETRGAAAPTRITVDMQMEMTWRIDDVDDEGTATMSQSFDRLGISMKTGQVAAVEYDSAVEPESAAAREMAEAMAPLIGPTFHLTMNRRGEILDVKLSSEAEEALTAESRQGLESLFSAQGISAVLRQAVVVFPMQPPAPGAQWETTANVDSPLGPLEQTSVFHLAGTVERDGRELEKIGVESTLAAKPDAARSRTKIKTQSQSGEIWFDRELGRPVRSHFEQQLTTQRPYRDTPIEVRSTSRLTTTFE